MNTIPVRREHDYVAARLDAPARLSLGADRMLPARDVPLHVWRTGPPSDTPLVLAHGLFGSIDKDAVAEPWLWPLLGPGSPIDLVLYDARGHGRSGDARTADGYTWDALGRDLIAVLDGLDIPRAVFGGSSLGAATAIAAAGLAPERVAGLLLFIPPPLGDAWTAHARPALSTAATVVRGAGVEALLRAMESRPENRSPLERPQRWAFERAHFASFPTERFATLMEGVGTGPPLDVDGLRAIDAPALVVHHENDADHPVASAIRLATLLQRAERCGQSGWDECLERPGVRADLIAGFVRMAARG